MSSLFPITSTTTGATGMEDVARSVLAHLRANLPAAIIAQTSLWGAKDVSFASDMGVEYEPIILEGIEDGNWHYGHIPSLINAPVHKYPNLAVLVGEMQSIPDLSIDQADEHQYPIGIEVMCKDLGSQERVNSRVWRTCDAIHSLFLNDKTLGGLFLEANFESADVSDVFIRKESVTHGTEWYWQGARLEYMTMMPAV